MSDFHHVLSVLKIELSYEKGCQEWTLAFVISPCRKVESYNVTFKTPPTCNTLKLLNELCLSIRTLTHQLLIGSLTFILFSSLC